MLSNIEMKRFLLRLCINKRYLIPRLFCAFLFTVALYIITVENLEKKSPNDALSDNRLLTGSGSTRACKFPQLLIDDPLIRKHFVEEKPLSCAKEKNWIYTDNGKFFIHNATVERHGETECDFYHIERIDDNHYSETKYERVGNDTPLIGDMFRVVCTGDDGATYENVHVGVPLPTEDPPPMKPDTNDTSEEKGPRLNVLMYVLDSVSRMHFMRKLPKFYRFLTEEFKGFTFEGYNIVGDSTTAALIPMLTGRFQMELPEARKRHENGTTMDDWPFIFKEYMAHGYVTSYIEEQAWTNALHMRLRGFDKPPVDHYMRALLIAVENQRRRQKPYCLGDTPESIVWLEYFRQLQVVLGPRNRQHFSILFTSETSHDFYNKVQALDEHLVENFKNLLNGGYFNDTLVFVLSDHGHRHVITRVTQTGKWEERLPFLFIRPPPWFCDRYPMLCENMRSNRDALVTAFDIHATLEHVTDLGCYPRDALSNLNGNLSERGISLFKRIPEERTCADAAISAHFCSCLEWEEVISPSNDDLVIGAAQYVVDKFNEKTTLEIPGACANLTVDKIFSARHLTPNEKLLAFKESLDYDNFFPDLSDNSTIAAVIYQVHFSTQPGPGDWEVSVTYFTHLRRYAMSMDSISRLNKYGDQARCVINDYPHLRMFCYCLRD